LINSGTTEKISGTVIDPIPSDTTYVPGSLTYTLGKGDYDPDPVSPVITWAGTLGSQQSSTHTHDIEFEVEIAGDVGGITIINEAEIKYGNNGQVSPSAETWVLPYIINGGFEEWWASWRRGGAAIIVTDTDTAPQRDIITDTAHSGNFSARLGHPYYECKGGIPITSAWISQAIFVPSTPSPELSFWYRIFTHDKNKNLDDAHDSFDVRIIDSLGHDILVHRDANRSGHYSCDHLRDLGWREIPGTNNVTIPLGDYKGSYITIRFENWNRSHKWYNTWTYVDDVQINPQTSVAQY
jgi:hypothetical protein